MKGFIITLFFICCADILTAQHAIDTLKLTSAYRELVQNPNSEEHQKKFFDAFPNTWATFSWIYNYYPNGDLTMYKLGYAHIMNGLGKLVTLIPDSVYCDKLIGLSIGGRWDADAPNFLRMVLRQTMQKKPEVMFQRLSLLWEGDVFPFWFFFFHSLHTTKDDVAMYGELKLKMQKKYPAIVKDMDIAFSVASGKASIPFHEEYK